MGENNENYTFERWLNDCRLNRIELYLFDYCEVNSNKIRLFHVVPKIECNSTFGKFCVWVNNDMYIYDTSYSAQKAFRYFQIGYQRGHRYEK